MALSTLRDFVFDWTATVASTGGVLASLVAFDVIQRVAIRRGNEAHQRAVSAMAAMTNRAYALTGGRTRATGTHHAQPGKPYIIVSNHQSMFDISLISEYLEFLQPRYVSKRENARLIPGVSYNLKHGGSALIDRGDPDQAHAAIEDVARRMVSDGWSVVIFPEGTRSRTGALKPFREGGLRTLIANAPGVSVLPVTMTGGARLFARNIRPVVRNVDLSMQVHAPIEAADPQDTEAFKAFLRKLEEIIGGAIPPESILPEKSLPARRRKFA
jgi:1-acyl-sn-glycerol-3-phosphate acyltransferase